VPFELGTKDFPFRDLGWEFLELNNNFNDWAYLDVAINLRQGTVAQLPTSSHPLLLAVFNFTFQTYSNDVDGDADFVTINSEAWTEPSPASLLNPYRGAI